MFQKIVEDFGKSKQDLEATMEKLDKKTTKSSKEVQTDNDEKYIIDFFTGPKIGDLPRANS